MPVSAWVHSRHSFVWKSSKFTVCPIARAVKVVTFMLDILHSSNSHWTLQGEGQHLIYLTVFVTTFSLLNKILLLYKCIVERSVVKLKESVLMWGMKEENQVMLRILSFILLWIKWTPAESNAFCDWRCVHWCVTLLPHHPYSHRVGK